MVSKIDINKSVPRERWGEFFDQFSSGNRERHISIEIIDSELGDEELIKPTFRTSKCIIYIFNKNS